MLPDNERVCPHDGHPLTEIGAVTSEQLDSKRQRFSTLAAIVA